MASTRQKLSLGLGITISAIFLILAFRNLDIPQFLQSLSDIDLPLLLLAALLYFFAVIIIALRWQFFLRAIQFVPLPALSQIVFIGYMGNNVYPLRAGDALRVLLLWRKHRVPLMRSTTVVVIERIVDGCVMLAFILFSLLFIELQSDTISRITRVAAPVFAVAMLLALFLAAQPQRLRRVLRGLLSLLPAGLAQRLGHISEEVIGGLEALRSPLNLLGAALSSFVTWGIEAGTYWLVLLAFGLDQPYVVALLLVGAVNLAGIIPASPGQIGVNEFVVITTLTALGLPASSASAYAVVVHLVIWLLPTVLGFGLLLRQGMGWADIRRASQRDTVRQLA